MKDIVNRTYSLAPIEVRSSTHKMRRTRKMVDKQCLGKAQPKVS
jgi:hypothetical protein